jgi:cell division protein FtsB
MRGARPCNVLQMKPPVQSRRAYWGTLAVATLLVGALAYHVICGEHGYLAYRSERQRYEALQKQALQLEQENQALQKHIDALKTDPKAVEKVAREQLHMAKPGEIVITYPDAQPKEQAAPNSSTPAPTPQPPSP